MTVKNAGVFVKMGKYPYYVVINGRKPGIYSTWEECNAQVDGYHSALYWGCYSEQEAIQALTSGVRSIEAIMERLKRPTHAQESSSTKNMSSTVTNVDDWKFIKNLVAILLITWITLVVVLIAVVVRLYLM